MAKLSVEAKVQQALELSTQGLTRQEIADVLYTSSDKKTRLGGLRKLMGRWGYVWNTSTNVYVLSEEIEANSQVTATIPTVHKELPVEESAELPVESATEVLTRVEIMEIKELLMLIKGTAGGLTGALRGTGTIPSEISLDLTEFTEEVQATTMQLHGEVWTALDAYCKRTKFSKKEIVNEAIWDFLKKWGEVEK